MSLMQFLALKKHLSDGNALPCYVVTGEDIYVVAKATKMLRELCGGFSEFNLHVFDGGSAESIVAALKTFPMMGGRVVVEVRGFTKDAGAIAEYLKKPSPDATLIIVSPSLTKNLSAFIKTATIIECDRLDEQSLKKWVIKRCEDNGTTITDKAAARLVAYSERFMSRVESEADKLSAYKHGGTIEIGDVEDLVMPGFEYKIYELGDAIVSRQKERALKVLSSLLESSSAGYVISGLYGHFRRLLHSVICKDASIAQYLGVKEFAVTASRRQASSIPPKTLKTICDRLSAADYDFKSGKITDVLAVQTIVARTVVELAEIS